MIEITLADRVFVLTGAGISAESGIPTFRGAGGFWKTWRAEDVATPQAWKRDPRVVWQFYSERRLQAERIAPNPAHYALATLEQKLGDRLFICTQNVDPLHEMGGARRVVHMHGELMKSRCERCAQPFHDEAGHDEVPRCRCGGHIRPHVVWFGELPFALDEIFEALEHCDVFVTIGSSGTVEPAASFPQWAGQKTSRGRARTYYIGDEEPANSVYFDQVFLGRAGELVPKVFPG